MQVIATRRTRAGNEVDPLPLSAIIPAVDQLSVSLCSHVRALYFDAFKLPPLYHDPDLNLNRVLSVVYMAGRIEAIRAIRAEKGGRKDA